MQGTTSFAKPAYDGCAAWPLVTWPVALFDRGSFADLAGQKRPAWTSPVFKIWWRAFDKSMQKDKKFRQLIFDSIVLWLNALMLLIFIRSFIIKAFRVSKMHYIRFRLQIAGCICVKIPLYIFTILWWIYALLHIEQLFVFLLVLLEDIIFPLI